MNANALDKNGTLLASIGRNWVMIFILIEIAFFSLSAGAFFSFETAQLILFYGTEVFLLGIAELFVIITGGIDLSVGYVMGFATIVSCKVMVMFQNLGLAPIESVLLGAGAALLLGLLPGLVNGWLVAKMRVPSFIATFSMLGICHGVSEILTKGQSVKGLPPLAGEIGNGYFLYFAPGRGLSFFVKPEVERGTHVWSIIPIIVVIAAVFIIIFGFLLNRTKFGRHLYAIGGNMDAAIRAGINVKRDLVKAYVVSSLFASIAGITYTLKYITGKPDAGSGMLLDGIAAVVIGGASMQGGSGTVWRTVLGSLVIAILETGLRIIGLQTFTTYIIVGAILILAVIIDQLFPNLYR